jgi:hypothetical protein
MRRKLFSLALAILVGAPETGDANNHPNAQQQRRDITVSDCMCITRVLLHRAAPSWPSVQSFRPVFGRRTR